MKHFINQELLAPNVRTIPVDFDIVSEFRDLALCEDPGRGFCTVVPWKNISDMRWISAETETAFNRFEDAYRRLGIADHFREYLDLDTDVRFYTGFLHTRRACKETNFHVDWLKTNNEGFTLLTPICGPESGQKLIYRKLTGEIAEYEYKPGEAIVFGDHFIHSSPAGVSDPPLSLLVFNFGTDKMEHWDKLLRTQGRQCPLVQQPDGRFVRVDPWKGTDGSEKVFDRHGLDYDS